MDSEVTNLAQVKAFDSSDYATAAQGTTADAAMQDLVDDTTPQLGGVLDTNGNNIEFPDSSGAEVNRLKFGAGDDLQIYHSGTHSFISEIGTGNLYISGSSSIELNKAGTSEKMLAGIADGAVELYYDNVKKLETTSDGVTITSTDDGAANAPILTLYRDSASPADFDNLGNILFVGKNDAGQDVTFAELESINSDVSDGTEDGLVRVKIMISGTLTNQFDFANYANVSYKNLLLTAGRQLVFEGSTDDGNETFLTVTDPTADRTITLPDATGTVALTSDINTANVTAAGALMDSEVTNLAQVKAFDSSDYATAAQGTTADAALPKAGGTMTGNLELNNVDIVFEGSTADANETTLTAIDPTADRFIKLPDRDGLVRVVDQQAMTANLAVGWHTIAVFQGRDDSPQGSNQRFHAKFSLADLASSRHQAMTFYAQSIFGQDEGLQIIGNSTFGTDVVTAIRIKSSADGLGLYAGAAIQVYVADATNNLVLYLDEANLDDGENGTSYGNVILKTGVADASDPGDVGYSTATWSTFAEDVQIGIDSIEPGGIGVTGNLLTQSNIVLEGATADAHETIITATDATADRTITLPDATGTVVVEETGGVTLNNGVIALKNGGTQSEVRLYCESSNAHYAGLKAPAHADFSGDVTSTLPSVTGTLIGTANADAPATTTSSSDADHVLVNDGGVLKKITPSDLGIGGGSYADSDVDTHLNTSTASANEVLSWNGSDYDWVAQSGGGGGGATNLTGLSDVTISSVQNNDLLMYNATASEWQNTNLGLTIDPSISSITAGGSSTIYETAAVTAVVVPSSGSYQNVSYFAEVRNSANTSTVVSNANISKSGGTFTFTAPSAGNYILRVKAQDFGDLASEFVTQSFTTLAATGPRYWRITGSGSSTYTLIQDIKFYTGAGQTGTVWPDTIGTMTNATTPSQFRANSSGQYGTYYAWEAFDSNTTSASSGWWNLGISSTYSDWYVELDTGQQATSISSARVIFHNTYHGGAQTIAIETSLTGAFAGEETVVATYSKPSSGGTHYIG
ncbi:MAG: hypothetical protein ACYTBY_06375 [Planctomycetota bacterium]